MSRPAIRTAGRVTVFCQDVPYPPTHGGKLDLWNLIRALHSKGHVIQLVCWFRHERIPSRVRSELSKVAEDVVEVPRRDGLWRLLIPKYPPRMLAFKPSTREYAQLLDRVAAFTPDWILLDHWLAYLPARAVATELRKVLVYRSQNVEHRYYREQSRLARGILKLKLAANLGRLFAAEREIRNTVDLVADISSDDRMEWEALGETQQGIVVPPIWLDSPPPSSPSVEQDIDLLFVGNLRTPNNVEGLRWFTKQVLPILRHELETPVRVTFAGSEPDPRDLESWRQDGVDCEANPPDVSGFYQRTRVVINPLQRGSGVNLKMIEAFAAGKPVVATEVAARGLPDAVRSHVSITATPQAFAARVHDILLAEERCVDRAERAALVARYFGTDNLAPLTQAVEALLTRRS
jgi:glycosyltransferase involved in cell wall biosynthesis